MSFSALLSDSCSSHFILLPSYIKLGTVGLLLQGTALHTSLSLCIRRSCSRTLTNSIAPTLLHHIIPISCSFNNSGLCCASRRYFICASLFYCPSYMKRFPSPNFHFLQSPLHHANVPLQGNTEMKPYFCALSELQKCLNKVHEETATDLGTGCNEPQGYKEEKWHVRKGSCLLSWSSFNCKSPKLVT